ATQSATSSSRARAPAGLVNTASRVVVLAAAAWSGPGNSLTIRRISAKLATDDESSIKTLTFGPLSRAARLSYNLGRPSGTAIPDELFMTDPTSGDPGPSTGDPAGDAAPSAAARSALDLGSWQ